MKNILFINKENSYNKSSLSICSRLTANYLNNKGIADAYVKTVIDNNDIDRVVTTYKPDICIIEAAWVVPSKFEELIALHPNVKFVVRIHSKAAFIATEGQITSWLYEYDELRDNHPKNFDLVFNNCESSRDYRFLGENSCLPNLYSSLFTGKYIKVSKRAYHIGCFGALRDLKNNYAQGVAVLNSSLNSKKEIHFHINDIGNKDVIKNLESLFENYPTVKLIKHGWLDHEEFLGLISKMDINLQVSFSESFNLVSADSIYQNVPVIGSRDMGWLPFFSQARAHEVRSIERALFFNRLPFVSFVQKLCLSYYNWKSSFCWRKYLR